MTKKKIERSGVLPYYIDGGEIKILFMRPSNGKYGGDVFQMAKGKHEDGEDPLEAGLREANEELGLFKGNITNTHKLGVFLGRTHVYVVEIENPDFFGDPHFETKETRWMTPEEFQAEGRDLHKPVVKAAVRWIEKQQSSRQQELDEIHLVVDQVNRNFSLSDFDLDTGQMVSKNEPSYEVWKYKAKNDPRLILFVLRSEESTPTDIISAVVGHFDPNDYFVIQQAWTDPQMRQQGFITSLYKTLHDRLQMSLASDLKQGPAMAKVWKKLPFDQKVFDRKTKKLIPREQVGDEEIYNNDDPTRYRLIIEHTSRYSDFGVEGVGDTIISEYEFYTHPSNKGKYI